MKEAQWRVMTPGVGAKTRKRSRDQIKDGLKM